MGTSVHTIDHHFVQAAMKAPFLEREQEHDLAVRWKEQQDEKALHVLTSAHMRLVIAMASRFRNYGLPLADLVQEGHIGLLEAAARFEPDRDVRFSTYATWWIRASLQDYILRNWSIVRGGTSSAQKSLFFNLRRLRAKITQDGAERMSQNVYSDIAKTVGVSTYDVAVMDSRMSGSDVSLNAMIGDEETAGSEKGDFLVDEAPLPDENAGMAIDHERRTKWIHSAMIVLNEREFRIVRERNLKDEQTTLESLGEKMGISKERVRQIESKAMEKLKKALMAHHAHEAFI